MSATFFPFLGLRLSLAGRPLNLIRPVRRRHLALFNVFRVTRLKCLSLPHRLVGLDALLAKPNQLFLAALTRLNDMRLLGVSGGSTRLVASH